MWDKALAIEQFLQPVAEKELMRFLGTVGYYRYSVGTFQLWWRHLDLLKARVQLSGARGLYVSFVFSSSIGYTPL